MKRVITAVLGVALAGTPFLVGCDKTVSEDKTVKKNADGSMTKDETTVKQQTDGTVVKTHDETKN